MILWLPHMFKIMLLRSTKKMYNHSSYLTVIQCSVVFRGIKRSVTQRKIPSFWTKSRGFLLFNGLRKKPSLFKKRPL
jgi:hypothetical protein